MEKKYNTRSPAVKRLMREAAELSQATQDYFAQPLQDNLFEWHFTVRGPQDTEFQDGVYHGRIIVPAEYPMKPPDIIVLTPNGRFEVGKKICLSISGFHPESWQPSWSIRTALLAIIAFMPTPGQGTIGSLDYPKDERQRLARRSTTWTCENCGCPKDLLPEPGEGATSTDEKQQQEMQDIVQNMALKSEEEVAAQKAKSSESSATAKNDEQKPVKEKPVSSPSSSSPAATTTASTGASSTTTSSTTSSSRSSTTTTASSVRNTTSSVRQAAAVQPAINRSNHMYDFMIILLVAAIAALLYRRINLMQDADGEPLSGPTE